MRQVELILILMTFGWGLISVKNHGTLFVVMGAWPFLNAFQKKEPDSCIFLAVFYHCLLFGQLGVVGFMPLIKLHFSSI